MYKLYELLEPFELVNYDVSTVPMHINFKTGLNQRLHPKETFTKGELTKVEYYKDYDGVTFDDMILYEEYTYNRNTAGLAINRSQNITWILVDGSDSTETKIIVKYYDYTSQIKEIKRRRANIINWLQGQGNIVALGDLVKPMVIDLQTEMLEYVNQGGDALVIAVQAYVAGWLDTPTPNYPWLTFRQFLVQELTI